MVGLGILYIPYFIWLICLIASWRLQSKNSWEHPNVSLHYSIIIPVRNEADNLRALFQSLSSLNFPLHAFEVILVDDHSAREQSKVYEELITGSPFQSRLLKLTTSTGKKSALNLGIKESQGDIIVTTDGDCIVHQDWLLTLAHYFEQQPRVNMVFGGVTFYNEVSIFHKLQTLEFSSLIGAGASSLSLNIPTMCNGANMSFRKNIFYEVGGYADNLTIPSGDDEFLMHKFYSSDARAVRFNYNSSGVVQTLPADSFKEFFFQRKRWASKWRLYKRMGTIVTALSVATINMLTICLFYIFIVSGMELFYGLLIIVKLFLEGVFLAMVLKFLGKKINIIHYLLLFTVYPFYVVCFGLAANFGKYSWKGRKH